MAGVNYEILVGNDHSDEPGVLGKLRDLALLSHCKVIDEPGNIGRAYVLNHLAKLASYPYLIIIDSDARLQNEGFIARYVRSAADSDVVCGGITTRVEDLRKDNRLRYLYESAATTGRSLEYRTKHPYDKFSTFNLLISRELFNSIGFDSHCYQYGYEDTVLGIDLMRKGVHVLHIDNPLVHTGIDSNESFLSKTEKALEVLVGLDERYQTAIQVSHCAIALRNKHMLWVMRLWHQVFGRLERWTLLKAPCLFVLKVYKLGLFSVLLAENKKKVAPVDA